MLKFYSVIFTWHLTKKLSLNFQASKTTMFIVGGIKGGISILFRCHSPKKYKYIIIINKTIINIWKIIAFVLHLMLFCNAFSQGSTVLLLIFFACKVRTKLKFICYWIWSIFVFGEVNYILRKIWLYFIFWAFGNNPFRGNAS